MQIVYVGNFRPSFSTENHIRRTLEDMGHQVIALQEDEIPTTHILKVSRFADLFLYTRTWRLQGNGLELLRGLEVQRVPTVSYHLDLYMGISREAGIQSDPFWQTKYVFTPDGDPRSAEKFKTLGINHFYMKPAVVKDECYLTEPVSDLQHDVIFVGSYDYHAEWSYRPKLIDWLRSTYGDGFKRYGNPAADDPNVIGLREHELNQLYNSAKIVVGDALCMGFSHEGYWSDRVPETLGRGGFLIHPYIKGLDEEFKDREHLVYYQYDDFDQLKELIAHYLQHPAEREKIRRAGHEFVKAQATYHNRMEQMLETLAQYEPTIRAKIGEPNG